MSSEYILGSAPSELERLGLQARLWQSRMLAHWERAGFRAGQTLLDLGCGPGYATADLARVAGPSGRVIAVDQSPTMLEHLRSQTMPDDSAPVEIVESDAQELEFLEEASLDGVWARWVFCFLKRPEKTLKALYRALRPGGVLVVFDYAYYDAMSLAPEGDAFRRVIQAVSASYRDRGSDPNVGRRLPHFMRDAGFSAVGMEPCFWLAAPSDPMWAWPTTFFSGYLPRLVEWGYLSPAEERAWENEWDAAEKDPLARFYSPVQLEFVARK